MGIILVIFRLLAAIVFGAGAIFLIYQGKDGWGWCIFASLLLGLMDYEKK